MCETPEHTNGAGQAVRWSFGRSAWSLSIAGSLEVVRGPPLLPDE